MATTTATQGITQGGRHPSNVLRAPGHIAILLTRLHSESEKQEAAISPTQYNSLVYSYDDDPINGAKAIDDLMRDKFIALEQDKAEFVYQTIVSTKSSYVVEAGTSFGVSTIYLALAIGEVERLTGVEGTVIATEKEAEKAQKARAHWKDCGENVENKIELRVGDLLETLATDLAAVDLLLLDIWAPMALPALKAVMRKLKPGAVVLTDNVVAGEQRYRDLLSVLRDPNGDFRSSTLPFKGGFEISIFDPR